MLIQEDIESKFWFYQVCNNLTRRDSLEKMDAKARCVYWYSS